MMFNRTIKFWALLVIGAMIAISIILYPDLPDELPRQFGLHGQVNSTWPKIYAVMVAPVMSILIFGLMQGLPRIDPFREEYAKFRSSYERLQFALLLFFLGLHVLTLTQYDNPNSVVRLLMLGIGLLFAALGNDMGRYRRTWFLGIRTPWTLADERVWRQTHRAAARWFVIVGLGIAASALVLPIPLLGVGVLIGILGLVAWVYVYSYRLYRRTNG
jgi:uncharacterized membrane protein